MSLTWLGIAQQPESEPEQELDTTNGDPGFLLAADKDLDQEESAVDGPKKESARPEGDLPDYITSLKTEAGDEGLNHNRKRPAEEDATTKATKSHVRSIPGRYSALDSDEEEEWFRNHEKEKAKRKAQRAAHGPNGSNGWSAVAHVIANGLQQTIPSDAFGQAGQQPVHQGQQLGYPGYHGVPNYRLPPQIYPTFQYGRRTRLYHPKLEKARDQEKRLDQQKASTSNGAAEKDKAKEADKDANENNE
ncbi:hypothetical protein BGZ67_000664, partial [Mortierella alpina]